METSKTENIIMIAKAEADVRAMRFLSNKKDRAPGSHHPAQGPKWACAERRPGQLGWTWSGTGPLRSFG